MFMPPAASVRASGGEGGSNILSRASGLNIDLVNASNCFPRPFPFRNGKPETFLAGVTGWCSTSSRTRNVPSKGGGDDGRGREGEEGTAVTELPEAETCRFPS